MSSFDSPLLDSLLPDPAAAARLADAEAGLRADPTRIRTLFPAAAREVARTPSRSVEPGEERVEDAVRVWLLAALAEVIEVERLVAELYDLYRYGDADERRAVLLGLPLLPVGDRALDLVNDALRTNDVRLVAAALGPYAATHLDAAAWRQGVLKCLFVGVPLRLVAGLTERADAELAAMVAAYADERRAAGRDVPADADLVLSTTTRES